MKKFLFSIMALFATVSLSAADNLTLGDVTVAQGKSALLPINITSVERGYRGFQFLLTLPDGFTATDVVKANRTSEAFTLKVQAQSTKGVYQVLVYNMDNQYFTGTEGAVAYINITAAEDKAVGEYTGKVSSVVMSTDQSYYFGDSEFTITVGNRMVFDELMPVQPSFNDGDKANITINRTLVGGAWNTICLPFPMNSSATKNLFGEGAEFAQFSGWSIDYMMADDGETPIFKGINVEFTAKSSFSAMSSIAAGVPFLVKPKADITVIELDNATLKKAGSLMKNGKVDGEENDAFPGLFVGTFVYTQVPEKCVFINSDKFFYSTGKTNIKGFRGWFNFGDVVLDSYAGSGDAKFSITVDGEATEIEGIPSYQRVTEGVYDLSGRKIQLKDGDLNKLQKGVYIINGKKVTIK